MLRVCAQWMVAYVPDEWSCLILRIHTDEQMVISTNRWSYRRLSNWVSQNFTYSPLMHPYMEITCITCPKTVLQARVFPVWEEKFKILGS